MRETAEACNRVKTNALIDIKQVATYGQSKKKKKKRKQKGGKTIMQNFQDEEEPPSPTKSMSPRSSVSGDFAELAHHEHKHKSNQLPGASNQRGHSTPELN